MSLNRYLGIFLALVLGGLCEWPAQAADDFLSPSVAFQLSARMIGDKRIELNYNIAPGYYLYRDRFKFAPVDGKLGTEQMQAGTEKYDAGIGKTVEVYHDQVVINLPIESASKVFSIIATHQGCAEKGLCYPPQSQVIDIGLKAFGAEVDTVQLRTADSSSPGIVDSVRTALLSPTRASQAAKATPQSTASAASFHSVNAGVANEDERLAGALLDGHLWIIIPLAFGFGLLLAMTPCVWPMLPIVSSIIVGQGRSVTPTRGFMLAAVYSLGMALVYTALGIAAGLAGQGLAVFLQNPIVLVAFGLLLGLLALSMFGVYDLQLPARLRGRLYASSESLSGGQLGGVFAMGVLSALIVSPCVSAPLAGALLYISQTRDAFLGGLALFMIATGMSVPLLLVGASAGRLLPRSGAWLERVKHFFGLGLLGIALYVMHPALPDTLTMMGYGLLMIVGAASLGAFESVSAPAPHRGSARVMKGLALVLALWGVLQFVGIASGGQDPLRPLAHLRLSPPAAQGQDTSFALRFERVHSLADLERRLRTADRPVLLDIYADWCTACKEMESQTLSDSGVRAKLASLLLLRLDVTANTEENRALLRRFNLFGPPGIIFFDAQGHEVEHARVIGFQDSKRFLANLNAAGL